MRPQLNQYFMQMAKLVATRSTCPRLSVGCVLTDYKGYAFGTGYNGAPKHVDHCSDVGCRIDSANHCTRAVHAEANALIQAAVHGISTKDLRLYSTHSPCERCMALLINAGIYSIVFETVYNLTDDIIQIAREANIHLFQVKDTEPRLVAW